MEKYSYALSAVLVKKSENNINEFKIGKVK